MEKHIYLTPDDNLEKSLSSAPDGAFVHLAPGVYRQKTILRKPGLHILGSGADKTRLVWSDYARKPDENGFAYITFRTYTLAVAADDVTMENLSVINDAGSPEIKGQQVALSVYGTNFTMKSCRLSSTQDTLFCGPLPDDLIERYDGFLPDCLRRDIRCTARFENCTICGTVDFIFGCGEADFINCRILSLPDARGYGFAAAPAHEKRQSRGFRFLKCSFACEPGVEAGSVYLARPWRDFGMCEFLDCSYADHIAPAGFDKWQGTNRDATARFSESPAVPGRVLWLRR